jgi:hypothetical protein
VLEKLSPTRVIIAARRWQFTLGLLKKGLALHAPAASQ